MAGLANVLYVAPQSIDLLTSSLMKASDRPNAISRGARGLCMAFVVVPGLGVQGQVTVNTTGHH